jgi:hypothetical protein
MLCKTPDKPASTEVMNDGKQYFQLEDAWDAQSSAKSAPPLGIYAPNDDHSAKVGPSRVLLARTETRRIFEFTGEF